MVASLHSRLAGNHLPLRYAALRHVTQDLGACNARLPCWLCALRLRLVRSTRLQSLPPAPAPRPPLGKSPVWQVPRLAVLADPRHIPLLILPLPRFGNAGGPETYPITDPASSPSTMAAPTHTRTTPTSATTTFVVRKAPSLPHQQQGRASVQRAPAASQARTAPIAAIAPPSVLTNPNGPKCGVARTTRRVATRWTCRSPSLASRRARCALAVAHLASRGAPDV